MSLERQKWSKKHPKYVLGFLKTIKVILCLYLITVLQSTQYYFYEDSIVSLLMPFWKNCI